MISIFIHFVMGLKQFFLAWMNISGFVYLIYHIFICYYFVIWLEQFFLAWINISGNQEGWLSTHSWHLANVKDQWNVQSCMYQKIIISFVVLVYEIKIISYYFQLVIVREIKAKNHTNSILTPSSVDITSISILWQKSRQPQWNNHQYHHRRDQNDHFHTDCSWPPSGIYHESGSVDTPTHSWHYHHHHH